MVDSVRYKDWHDKANADLKSAKILFEHDADYGIVAFHCQQAIEKLLKSFVLKRASDLIEGHSLVFLCKKAIELDTEFKNFLKDCAYINQFYIETRYPADVPIEMTQEEAGECISITEKIFAEVSKKL
ncbi:MAG TPA: HEPN domain-containing protein [Candidatus Wallbacteria bacterium]|nr:HEPN domain-containing protein [Candidatus Wallbacteria bacterium]